MKVKDKGDEGIGDQSLFKWANGVNQGSHNSFLRNIKKGQVRSAQTQMLSNGQVDFKIKQRISYRAEDSNEH